MPQRTPYRAAARAIGRAAVVLALAVGGLAGPIPAAAQPTIQIDPGTTHQTIRGWEAIMAWRDSSTWPNRTATMNHVIDLAVNELGINRFRLEVASGLEHDQDNYSRWVSGQISNDAWRCNRYETVNDNADPDVIDWSGFQFRWLDDNIENIVVPMKQAVEANGEKLYVNLNYVAFTRQICSGPYIHGDAEEYAEFILAVYLHMRDTYGFVPDACEVILEPDLVPEWNGSVIGRAIVATAAKLEANGFTPRFITPSATNMGNVVPYFNALNAIAGAKAYVSEISYHRYSGNNATNLQAIANLGAQHGIPTAMLEWWSSSNTHETLHDDLRNGRNSAWQRGGLAFEGSPDNGAALYKVEPGTGTVRMNNRTKFFRQYFKWVRPGAERIGASSSSGSFAPLAFVNADGSNVVVVKASSGGSFRIDGLPAGRYVTHYTTGSQTDVLGPETDVAAGTGLSTSIPASGVLTVVQLEAGGPPPGVAPQPPILLP